MINREAYLSAVAALTGWNDKSYTFKFLFYW